MLRYLTAGESHGKGLVAILEGMPAGLKVEPAGINRELRRRQAGFGRGKRMRIERDRAEILCGLKGGRTIGSPLAIVIRNKDSGIEKLHQVLAARPGHADLAGLLKYGFDDIRAVLERASARATAATVGIGAVCKMLLGEFGVRVGSSVLCIGGEETPPAMRRKIEEAKRRGDTIGGVFAVTARGVPAGLGSYAQPDRRLDGRLGQALASIPGIKSVEFGLGLGYAVSFGSEVHDCIYYSKGKGYFRKTNNAGGIEGGVSNGEEVILRCAMKPIATLLKPLASVNVATKKAAKAAVERADICVVEAAGVVAESACALVLADAFLEKFGADCLSDIKNAYKSYLKRTR